MLIDIPARTSPETVVPVPETALTRVSGRQARMLYGVKPEGIREGRVRRRGPPNNNDRPPRVIVINSGTTRRPEGIGSDTGGAPRERPKAKPMSPSGHAARAPHSGLSPTATGPRKLTPSVTMSRADFGRVVGVGIGNFGIPLTCNF
ncbi:hypothetical protein IMCC20628_01695 [Hoeflea sp. IMCC20628]|uniref:hypothetical protein n=1 Tax=Hoeflea sp. IMCC20628 TaxID=1620421 RepID=UPI00063A9932|nr:hypothetical protein [Hoeflea sp. IMCC20628]AKI00409.1 hypothetical protein IMCC20628_01695 [Hoeflea sp. IMCC20628]